MSSVFIDSFKQLIREAIREELRETAISPRGEVREAKETPYLSVKEAAEAARLSPSTIRLYIRKGQLAVNKVGRRVLINRTELERFLQANSTAATASSGLINKSK
jgi:excisionase family DNA binding protein